MFLETYGSGEEKKKLIRSALEQAEADLQYEVVLFLHWH